MNRNAVNDKRMNERVEYAAAIQCHKIISAGQVRIFDPPIEMDVKNIASEGLCISSLESFAESAILKFDIALENSVYPNVTATVIWKTNRNNAYYYGIHFQNMSGKLGTHIIEIGRKVFRRI